MVTPALNSGMLPLIIHQFGSKGGGQIRALPMHKIIHIVTYADALHLLMRADITPGSLINIPLFHIDKLAQPLQAQAAVVVTDMLFAVYLSSACVSSLLR